MKKHYDVLGVAYAPNILDKERAYQLASHINDKDIDIGFADPTVIGATCYNLSPDINREINQNFSAVAEPELGELKLTDIKVRRYVRGTKLMRHTDDYYNGDVAVSLCLGFSGLPPTFHIVTRQGNRAFFNPAPGGAIVYDGRNLPHWRDRLVDTEWSIHALLYYDMR